MDENNVKKTLQEKNGNLNEKLGQIMEYFEVMGTFCGQITTVIQRLGQKLKLEEDEEVKKKKAIQKKLDQELNEKMKRLLDKFGDNRYDE